MKPEIKEKLDAWVVENYEGLHRFYKSVRNTEREELLEDVVNECVLKLYEMDDDRLGAMLEGGYVTYYFRKMLYSETMRQFHYSFLYGGIDNRRITADEKYKGLATDFDFDFEADDRDLEGFITDARRGSYLCLRTLIDELGRNEKIKECLRMKCTDLERLVYDAKTKEGKTYRKLESECGISRSTLYTIYHRALDKIRQHVK